MHKVLLIIMIAVFAVIIAVPIDLARKNSEEKGPAKPKVEDPKKVEEKVHSEINSIKEKIASIEAQQKSRLDEIEKEKQDDISKSKSAHESKVKEINNNTTERIKLLKSRFDEDIAPLKKQLSDLENPPKPETPAAEGGKAAAGNR